MQFDADLIKIRWKLGIHYENMPIQIYWEFLPPKNENFQMKREWSGGAKVLCILRHQGIQLILAYNWARPAILVAGKGRGEFFYFFCFFTFIPVPLSSLSLFHLFYYLFYLFSPFLWETTQNDPQG